MSKMVYEASLSVDDLEEMSERTFSFEELAKLSESVKDAINQAVEDFLNHN
jgi:hypothetical protein